MTGPADSFRHQPPPADFDASFAPFRRSGRVRHGGLHRRRPGTRPVDGTRGDPCRRAGRPRRRARPPGRQPRDGVRPLARRARARQHRPRGDARSRHDRPPDLRLRARRQLLAACWRGAGDAVGRVDGARPPRALPRGQRPRRSDRGADSLLGLAIAEARRLGRPPGAGGRAHRLHQHPERRTRPRSTPRSTPCVRCCRPATAATAPNISAVAGCTAASGASATPRRWSAKAPRWPQRVRRAAADRAIASRREGLLQSLRSHDDSALATMDRAAALLRATHEHAGLARIESRRSDILQGYGRLGEARRGARAGDGGRQDLAEPPAARATPTAGWACSRSAWATSPRRRTRFASRGGHQRFARARRGQHDRPAEHG